MYYQLYTYDEEYKIHDDEEIYFFKLKITSKTVVSVLSCSNSGCSSREGTCELGKILNTTIFLINCKILKYLVNCGARYCGIENPELEVDPVMYYSRKLVMAVFCNVERNFNFFFLVKRTFKSHK